MYEWDSGELDMNITKITRHPKYDDDGYKYDVAILKLATSLTFDAKIKAIELNDEVTCPHPGVTCTVAGWGKMDRGFWRPSVLSVWWPGETDGGGVLRVRAAGWPGTPGPTPECLTSYHGSRKPLE
ncbi:hypothetical protein ACOMHN_066258 [Nucella lapillus]